jgi:hypothetical protein
MRNTAGGADTPPAGTSRLPACEKVPPPVIESVLAIGACHAT